MRPRTPERLWSDSHEITVDQARLLGGYLRLIELEKNQPDIFHYLLNEARKRRKAA
jgi:hypothetical protein